MALQKCKECSKEFSSQAEKCPHCGAPNPKHGIVALLGIIIVGGIFYVSFYGLPGGSSGPLGGIGASQFTISVSGTAGTPFSGSYMTFGLTGESTSKSVDGSIPKSYTVSGNIVSCTFQKQSESGSIKVEIVKNGQIVSQSESSAAYGLVSAATR